MGGIDRSSVECQFTLPTVAWNGGRVDHPLRASPPTG